MGLTSAGGAQTPFYQSMGFNKGHTALRLKLTLGEPPSKVLVEYPHKMVRLDFSS